MKNLFVKSLALVLFIVICNNANAQTITNLIGTWHNELQSTLRINSINSNTGRLVGTYTLNTGKTFTLTGWANDLPAAHNKSHVVAVAFSVQFGSFGSITSWTGYLKGTGSSTFKIQTIWNLVNPISDEQFDHIVTNCDIFTPGPAK